MWTRIWAICDEKKNCEHLGIVAMRKKNLLLVQPRTTPWYSHDIPIKIRGFIPQPQSSAVPLQPAWPGHFSLAIGFTRTWWNATPDRKRLDALYQAQKYQWNEWNTFTWFQDWLVSCFKIMINHVKPILKSWQSSEKYSELSFWGWGCYSWWCIPVAGDVNIQLTWRCTSK